MSDQRVSILQIPNWLSVCEVKAACPYRDDFGCCDEPRINKGNSDSACHSMSNKALLQKLD